MSNMMVWVLPILVTAFISLLIWMVQRAISRSAKMRESVNGALMALQVKLETMRHQNNVDHKAVREIANRIAGDLADLREDVTVVREDVAALKVSVAYASTPGTIVQVAASPDSAAVAVK